MSKNDKSKNLKKILIDLLKLNFLADEQTIDMLSNIDYESGEVSFYGRNGFSIHRKADRQYENVYSIGYYKNGDYLIFGVLKFNYVSTKIYQEVNFFEDKQVIWLDVHNPIFYSDNDILLLNLIEKTLNLRFHRINQIDLCSDRTFNIYERVYLRNIKNKEIEVLVNGRLKCKDELLREAKIDSHGSLNDPYQIKTYQIKQKNATKDKTKGNYLIMYDKKDEIENTSHKNYILDYYGNPDVLHRLEVHICKEKAEYYFSKVIKIDDNFNFNMLTNQKFLKEMYDYFLNSLLRFRTVKRTSKGRKVKNWNVLLR